MTDRVFYEVFKQRIKDGQYTMNTITAEIKTALGKGYITFEDEVELLALAETSIDSTYNGNTHPTKHDSIQDVKISANEMSVLEAFEMIMILMEGSATATQQAKMMPLIEKVMSRSAIGDTYVSVILQGLRTFSSVHVSKKQEVADKLTTLGRCDLIDVSEYHPPHEDCLHGNKPQFPEVNPLPID